jgi:hypothetical protein
MRFHDRFAFLFGMGKTIPERKPFDTRNTGSVHAKTAHGAVAATRLIGIRGIAGRFSFDERFFRPL